MYTYLLSDQDVRHYATDFLQRLDALQDRKPQLWVSLGLSGDKLVDVLDVILEGKGQSLPSISQMSYDRYTKEIVFRDDDASKAIEEAAGRDLPIVLLDSAIHSGGTMKRVATYLLEKNIKEVISYSLVIKQSSEFIPTFFGLMIGECDRAFFQLPAIPNHRLATKAPIGTLRLLDPSDLDRPFPKTEASSINDKNFGDLYYLSKTQGFRVYVYEIGREIAGVLSFKMMPNRHLFIDLIARDEKYKDAKIGGMLLRAGPDFP